MPLHQEAVGCRPRYFAQVGGAVSEVNGSQTNPQIAHCFSLRRSIAEKFIRGSKSPGTGVNCATPKNIRRVLPHEKTPGRVYRIGHGGSFAGAAVSCPENFKSCSQAGRPNGLA